jgi:protein-disulfide isomerase
MTALSRRTLGWRLVALAVVITAGAWLALDPGFGWRWPASKILAEISQDEFDRRVHDYVMAHPEVIMESVNQLETRAREKAETDVQRVLQARADEVFRDPDSPIGGNPNGDVTLVEFFDYNCPYCRQVAPVVTKAEDADSQLRVVYKEFPILGPNSTFAAKAALAAHKQGKYVEFHRALYQLRGAVDQSKAMEVAAAVGLDVVRLKTDMEDSKIQASIQKNLALAQVLRINGTPGFVIGDQILRGATDLNTLQAWIRTAREHRQ